MLALITFGFGVYVGLHFNVLALLPLSFLGAGALVATSWSSGQDLHEGMLLLILPAIALQAGFMIGLSARDAYRHLLVRFNLATKTRLIRRLLRQ